LDVLHTRQNLVLDLELDFHAELCAFLDCEGLGFESLHLAGLAHVDNDIRATFDLDKVRPVLQISSTFVSYLKTQ
jgi:hypothetical protein